MLSRYTITAWDVIRPLSANVSAAPFSILDLVRPQSHPVGGRTQRRSRARMETAQREEIRRSLKAAIIWVSCHTFFFQSGSFADIGRMQLMLKGLEPIFDYSVGYVMPFYSTSKALTLLIYIAFRPEVSREMYHVRTLRVLKTKPYSSHDTSLTLLCCPLASQTLLCWIWVLSIRLFFRQLASCSLCHLLTW